MIFSNLYYSYYVDIPIRRAPVLSTERHRLFFQQQAWRLHPGSRGWFRSRRCRHFDRRPYRFDAALKDRRLTAEVRILVGANVGVQPVPGQGSEAGIRIGVAIWRPVGVRRPIATAELADCGVAIGCRRGAFERKLGHLHADPSPRRPPSRMNGRARCAPVATVHRGPWRYRKTNNRAASLKTTKTPAR
jgi:hypothetical protein